MCFMPEQRVRPLSGLPNAWEQLGYLALVFLSCQGTGRGAEGMTLSPPFPSHPQLGQVSLES